MQLARTATLGEDRQYYLISAPASPGVRTSNIGSFELECKSAARGPLAGSLADCSTDRRLGTQQAAAARQPQNGLLSPPRGSPPPPRSVAATGTRRAPGPAPPACELTRDRHASWSSNRMNVTTTRIQPNASEEVKRAGWLVAGLLGWSLVVQVPGTQVPGGPGPAAARDRPPHALREPAAEPVFTFLAGLIQSTSLRYMAPALKSPSAMPRQSR
jgi:hypothetical protein